MIRAASFLLTEANRKGRRIALLAILIALGVTALSLGARQAQAEPPDPCHHECEF